MKKSSNSRLKANPQPVMATITRNAAGYGVTPIPSLSRGKHDSVLWVNSTGKDVIVCMSEDCNATDRAFLSTRFYVPNAAPNEVPTGPVRSSAHTINTGHEFSISAGPADECPCGPKRRIRVAPRIIIVP
jgi:hypothetical protein